MPAYMFLLNLILIMIIRKTNAANLERLPVYMNIYIYIYIYIYTYISVCIHI